MGRQPLDILCLLNVINPPTLAEAVKTTARMDKFELDRETAHQYSLNRVHQTPDSDDVTDGEAEEFENYFHKVMDNDVFKGTGGYSLSRRSVII